MTKVKIADNTTALDVAFNLSGSLTGFPAVLVQLPAGVRVGFATFPELWEDVTDVGQTWTPDIQGLSLELDIPIYNTMGASKQPYTTPLFQLESVVAYGNAELEDLLT